ncbi:MAG: FlgD immunoglobulin-like domain containing protein [Acidobacteriota bacterium]
MRRFLAVAFALMCAEVTATAGPTHVIRSAKVDRSSLNVAAHEVVTFTVDFAQPGVASVGVVDRDGYVVRTLAKAQPVSAGPVSFGWDARDDSGEFVADEAYSFKVDWRGTGGTDSYFPADAQVPMTTIDARSYDRRTATLSYTLPRPSRVHVQAGTAVLDPKTKELVGPVMKTIVNREPRVAGAIAEHWSGFDESGAIFIPDLENFVVAIAASPLPENSVSTFGNRKHAFVETLAARRGPSLLTRRDHGEHHAGLTTVDDTSPQLIIEPLNAIWSAADRTWILTGKDALRLRLSVKGPTAAAFRAQPAKIFRFVDGRQIATASPTTKDGVIAVPLDARGGVRRVSVNWRSEWGPLAANTIQIRVVAGETAAGGTR